MSRPRSRVGAELAPLVMILACLVGSLALIVRVHRGSLSRSARPIPVAVVSPPAPLPVPAAAPPRVELEIPEVEPTPPPLPEDPTPKALAGLISAEAEQLLEASRADRRSQSLEEARKSALRESEKWRRRESLVNSQLATLENKARKLETETDELALERDALLRERDAKKAAAAVGRTQPNQAILPHKGPNGTWRRPIVVECTNGMAILRPRGLAFGLLDLSSGFGPSSNAFVAAVAREAVRIQHNKSPDGSTVVPYIFFLVRPDGVRPYYEARGRLEPLGITFGYELADQDWAIDFPDLDDPSTWDGSAPRVADDPLATTSTRPSTGSPAEDDAFPDVTARGLSSRPRTGDDPSANPDFTWPGSRSLSRGGGSGSVRLPDATGGGSRSMAGSGIGGPVLDGIPGLGGSGPSPTGRAPGEPDPLVLDGEPPRLRGSSDQPGSAPKPGGSGTPGTVKPGSGVGQPPRIPGRIGENSPSGNASKPGEPGPEFDIPPKTPGPVAGRTGANPPSRVTSKPGESGSEFDIPPRTPGDATGSTASGRTAKPAGSGTPGVGDPGSDGDGSPTSVSGRPSRPISDEIANTLAQGGSTPPITDDQPPVVHRGPFHRPLAMGLQSASTSGSSSSSASASASASASNPNQTGSAGPPPTGLGVGTPGGPEGSPASGSSSPRLPGLPDLSPSSIIDRRYEVVLVCGARGVIVQPGGYRVTANALKDRDGLLKKQVVALVKAKRAADPKVIFEPKVRFLVQPGGESIYWTARSQILLSGLDYPMTTQVADPDPLSILPSEGW